jgi:prefoldin alpha subunit
MAEHDHDHEHGQHEHHHDHAKEEEFNRLVYMQNAYSQQYEAISGELTTFSMAQGALQRSLDLLKRKDEIRDASVLLSAEGGTYIEASIRGIEKAITYVGAGYLVEKDVESAKEYIGRSIASSEDAIGRLMEDRKKLGDELMRIQYAIEAMQQGL